jgi:hypothetical protein
MPSDHDGRPPANPDREASGVDVWGVAAGQFAVLYQARARLLAQWCAELIPARPGRPSAAQAGAAEYIDRVCSSSPVLRCALIVALDGLDAVAQDLLGQLFVDCRAAQRAAALDAFAAADSGSFGLIKNLAYESYYSTPMVLADLERVTGWRASNAVTGSPMEPFDQSALERVRALPPGYRDPG